MFAIMFFKYIRFFAYLYLLLAIIAPGIYDEAFRLIYARTPLIKWLIQLKPVQSFLKGNKNFSSDVLIAGTMAMCLFGFSNIFSVAALMPNNDINDLAEYAGYTQDVIEEIQARGYTNILNSYDAGSWLLYNGIQVSQDNRCDLYMEQFSGKNYILMDMGDSVQDIDEWVDENHPDAIVLSYEGSQNNFAYNTPERYSLVWEKENPIKSVSGSVYSTMHWAIYEISYAD
jgi:hypothetical protein